MSGLYTCKFLKYTAQCVSRYFGGVQNDSTKPVPPGPARVRRTVMFPVLTIPPSPSPPRRFRQPSAHHHRSIAAAADAAAAVAHAKVLLFRQSVHCRRSYGVPELLVLLGAGVWCMSREAFWRARCWLAPSGWVLARNLCLGASIATRDAEPGAGSVNARRQEQCSPTPRTRYGSTDHICDRAPHRAPHRPCTPPPLSVCSFSNASLVLACERHTTSLI